MYSLVVGFTTECRINEVSEKKIVSDNSSRLCLWPLVASYACKITSEYIVQTSIILL